MLDFVDCQAQAIGAGGYQALAAPGSTLSLVLTGFLTLFVALFGYRMLFGHAPERARRRAGAGQDRHRARAGDQLDRLSDPDLRRRPSAARPSSPPISAGRPALPGAGGGLVGRLDLRRPRRSSALAVAGTAGCAAARRPADAAGAAERRRDVPGLQQLRARRRADAVPRPARSARSPPSGWSPGCCSRSGPSSSPSCCSTARAACSKAGCACSPAPRSGALGTAIVLGVELALLEPWLADLLARRYAGQPIPGAPVELFVATLLFALVPARHAYRLGAGRLRLPAAAGLALRAGAGRRGAARRAAASSPARPRGRRRAGRGPLARRRGGRRGRRHPAARGRARPAGAAPRRRPRRRGRTRPCTAPARDLPAAAPTPLGQSFRRRTTARVSAQRGQTGPALMKKQTREALDAYYVEADSWARDRQDALARLAADRLVGRRRRRRCRGAARRSP